MAATLTQLSSLLFLLTIPLFFFLSSWLPATYHAKLPVRVGLSLSRWTFFSSLLEPSYPFPFSLPSSRHASISCCTTWVVLQTSPFAPPHDILGFTSTTPCNTSSPYIPGLSLLTCSVVSRCFSVQLFPCTHPLHTHTKTTKLK